MSYVSDLRGVPIIDDSNYKQFAGDGLVDGHGMSRGFKARDYSAHPFGSYAERFSEPLIPRSEWADRIEEMERKKSTLADVHDYYDIPVLDQNGNGYCWCFGAVKAMMVARAVAGLPPVFLSAASAAAKIKNGRDEGGWAGEAVEGIEKYGVSDVEFWPEHSRDIAKYDTPDQRANAQLHKFAEWWELPQNNFDAVMTCLLRRLPTTLGLMWWGHLVCGLAPRVIGRNAFGVEIVNSWKKTWGKNGRSVLEESKATPHEALAIRSVTASRK